jgi:hypothetical protein
LRREQGKRGKCECGREKSNIINPASDGDFPLRTGKGVGDVQFQGYQIPSLPTDSPPLPPSIVYLLFGKRRMEKSQWPIEKVLLINSSNSGNDIRRETPFTPKK